MERNRWKKQDKKKNKEQKIRKKEMERKRGR